MIRASRSLASSSSKRMPFTVPAVPTGMKTGVSITPRRVVNRPARAWEEIDSTSKAMGSFVSGIPRNNHGELHKTIQITNSDCGRAAQQFTCSLTPGPFLVPFDDSQRCRKEVELFTQAILHMSFVRKVNSRFAASRENYKRRWAHSNLSQVLYVKPRNAAAHGRG